MVSGPEDVGITTTLSSRLRSCSDRHAAWLRMPASSHVRTMPNITCLKRRTHLFLTFSCRLTNRAVAAMRFEHPECWSPGAYLARVQGRICLRTGCNRRVPSTFQTPQTRCCAIEGGLLMACALSIVWHGRPNDLIRSRTQNLIRSCPRVGLPFAPASQLVMTPASLPHQYSGGLL